MTAQEAVEILSDIRSGYNCFDSVEEEYYRASSMAIDLLLRYDDLISRTELIHKLKHLEQFNNKDVPDWVWSAIGGTNE